MLQTLRDWFKNLDFGVIGEGYDNMFSNMRDGGVGQTFDKLGNWWDSVGDWFSGTGADGPPLDLPGGVVDELKEIERSRDLLNLPSLT